jgi:hypothetical protein
MRYSFSEEAIIGGDIDAVWATATDVAAWSSWDPHMEKARIEGEFTVGAKGWSKPAGAPGGPFTVTGAEPGRTWSVKAGIPFGSLCGQTSYQPAGDGKIRISKRVEITGPFGPLFHLIWEKNMRADMQKTFAALEGEARRRG